MGNLFVNIINAIMYTTYILLRLDVNNSHHKVNMVIFGQILILMYSNGVIIISKYTSNGQWKPIIIKYKSKSGSEALGDYTTYCSLIQRVEIIRNIWNTIFISNFIYYLLKIVYSFVTNKRCVCFYFWLYNNLCMVLWKL